MTATETKIIATYAGAENTEAHVAEITGGFSATLFDLDAGESVGSIIFFANRFDDAAARADAKAREFVA